MARPPPRSWKYGDPDSHDLRHALAAHHGVAPENIMWARGSTGFWACWCG
jgi:histidinol-phosphate aminotransferase